MSAFPEKKKQKKPVKQPVTRGWWGGGRGNRGDCGTGVRASISKPTPSSEMLTYSYTALRFLYPFIAGCQTNITINSLNIEYQENKQPRKLSERKICMSEKWGLSHRNPEKSGHSYTFC